LAVQLLKLAQDVAAAESKRATEYQEARIVSGGFAAGRGRFRDDVFRGRGRSSPNDEEEEDDFPRSHVLARLSDLAIAVENLKPLVPDETQAQFDGILAALEPAITATADKDTVGLNVARALRSMADAVKRVTAPAAAVAADEAADFEAPPDAAADEAKAAQALEPPADSAPPGAAPTTDEQPTKVQPAAEEPAQPEAAPENGQ
jgi:hypothetical protein